MGENSGIEWTTHTWNPWQGCFKVSSGCKNCYMFTEMNRWKKNPGEVVRSSDATFNNPLGWHKRIIRGGGSIVPVFVFTCSWSDFFLEEADPWRDDAWDIIRKTPHLTYQILTKRPERIPECLPDDWGEGYPNVWLGVTIEDDRQYHRALALRLIPARVKFISFEPLLAGVPSHSMMHTLMDMDWAIIGGESGPRCRPMNLEWAENLVITCLMRKVPVFVKQLGGHPDRRGGDKARVFGRLWHEFPGDVES